MKTFFEMDVVQVGDLIIDPRRFSLLRNGNPITLTKTEFKILYLLMSKNGYVFSRQQITQHVWGAYILNFPRTIDVHICNIKRKVGKIGDKDVITVLKGVGYKLNNISGSVLI